jgi:radical SAM superfamily enzyme YgiQ (UPF0313 family)
MNILLVYPEFPDTFWSFKYALRFIRKKASSPPLGLLTIAAMLPHDWSLKLVDMNVHKLKDADIVRADYVFISGMTIQKESARDVIARCNQLGTRVVCGGPLFTMEYQEFSGVDHFILNEAEITLKEFFSDLHAGAPKKVYATDSYADMQESPTPRWDLIDFNDYATMNIQYSRGCPFNCDFCNVTALLGHRMRLKSAAQILDELDGLYARGWRAGVFFVDDNLIGNKKLLKEDLLPALIDWRRDKAGIAFNTEASINLADDDQLLRLMVEAGFNQVFIGIETPENDNLLECSKKQNLNRDLVEDIRKIQRAGLQVQGGFIVGFDNDSPGTFRRLIDFIQQSGIATAMVGLLQAPIGTALYERMEAAGRLIKNISGDNVNGATNIIPRMNIDLLTARYKKLLTHIYTPEMYYQRVITFLKEYHLPKIKISFSFRKIWQDVSALARSIVRLGIFGRERKQYWNLFFWTLFNRPRLFPLAITMAVYGFHFRMVSERHLI